MVTPCCSAVAAGDWLAEASAVADWAVVTVIPVWRATWSLIWNLISQVKVACVSCVGVRLMTPGYLLAAWLRLLA